MNRGFTTLLLLCLSLVCLCTALIRPARNFNASNDALILANALKPPENVRKITDVLTRRSAEQRLAIGKILVKKNKHLPVTVLDLLGCRLWNEPEYKTLVTALLTPLHELYANDMSIDSTPGNCNTDAFVDVFTTWPHSELKAIYEEYIKKKPELLKNMWLTQRVIDGAIKGLRNETQEVDVAAAIADAKTIYDLSRYKPEEQQMPDDGDRLEDIFIKRSHRQLLQVFKEYKNLNGSDIEEVFKNYRWSTQMRNSYHLSMIPAITSIPNYYATSLYYSLAPCTFRRLTRIIVSRSELDLDEIKEAFRETRNLNLTSAIENTTSGEYKRAILAIVNS